jgi:hypothetical protein
LSESNACGGEKRESNDRLAKVTHRNPRR